MRKVKFLKKFVLMFLAFSIVFGALPVSYASAENSDFSNAIIKLSASNSGRLARNTSTKVFLVDKDTGEEISTDGVSSIKYAITPQDRASIDENGLLTTLKNGVAVLTVTIKPEGADAVVLSKNIDIQDSGENLMAHLNASFEEEINDSNWPWSKSNYNASTYIEPENPDTFYYTAVKTVTRDGNNDNKAFAVYMNPDITSIGSHIHYLKYGVGGDPRLRLELPKNTIYEMSFFMKADSLVLPAGCTVTVFYDIYAHPGGGSTGLLPVATNRNGKIILTKDLDWTKITVPVAAPTDSTGDYIYATPRILVQATAGKSEVSGCIYIDDIEIRRVGYDYVDVTWPNLSAVNTSGTLLIQPIATTGSPISIGTAVFTDNITVTSSNAEVAEVPSSVTRQVFPSNSGIHRGSSNITLKTDGESLITVSANVNEEIKTNTKKVSNYNLSALFSSIELALGNDVLAVSDTVKATVSGILSDSGQADLSNADITFKTSSPAVADVDNYGIITGISAGTAAITAIVTLDGITKTDTATITVTAAGTPMATGRLSINADNISGNGAGAINTGDSGYDSFGTSAEYSVGSSVTLTAAPTYEGKQFMYWKNSASNRIVSGDNQYTFKVGSNTSVTAIYRDTEKGYLVEFFDKNGRVLLTDHLDDIKTSVIAPLPYSAGYEFLNWQSGNVFVNAGESVTASTVGGAQAAFLAQYDKETKTYTVVVDDGVNITSNSYAYNTEVTVTPGDFSAGQKFAYWTRGGEIVSYEAEYSFYVWDDTTITAVSCAATDSITKVPSIAMDTIKVVPNGDGYRVLFLAERTVPNDYTLIESGILISTAVAVPTLESSNTDKAIAQTVSPNGQFTARKDGVMTGTTCYARGYMIYKTSSNAYEIIYSNTVNETV